MDDAAAASVPVLPVLPVLPGTTPPRRLDHIVQGPYGAIQDISHLMQALARAKEIQERNDSPCLGLLAGDDRAFCIVGAAFGVTALFDARLRPGTRLISQATPIAPTLLRRCRPLTWVVAIEVARKWFEL